MRQQLLHELAKMEEISERIGRQCWGAMVAKGRPLAGLRAQRQVWSLPLEAVEEEERALQQVGVLSPGPGGWVTSGRQASRLDEGHWYLC